MANKYYTSDVGTEILVDVGCVISTATDTKLKVLKPNGDIVEWSATISGTNYLLYTTTSGDFSPAGTYSLQASLTIDGWGGRGETANFRVYENFE